MKMFLRPFISILAVASLLTAGNAMAQNQKSGKDWQKGPPSVEERLVRISEALDLGDEQALEMLAVLQEQERNRQALHEQTMAIMGADICAQKAQTEEAMLAILNAEQTELFLQMKEERQTRVNKRNHSRNGDHGPDCS